MEPYEIQEITQRINRLLKEKKTSAAQMARELGFSSGLYTQWRHGQQTPSPDKLIKMADYFGVSVDYLLGHDPNPAASELRREIIQAMEPLELPALERVLDYVRFAAEQQEKSKHPRPLPPFPDF